MGVENIGKQERKKYVKTIEGYLRNFNTYKAAAINTQDRIEFLISKNKDTCNEKMIGKIKKLQDKLNGLESIIQSIERALDTLSETEKLFVQYRFFSNWSIRKTALKMGYSDKNLFVIRNQVMDKLIISLNCLI